MALISDRAAYQGLLATMVILAIMAIGASKATALPAPLSLEELATRSDLVIEGRVARVWLYSEWLNYLQAGGLGSQGQALLQRAPATDAGMLHLLRDKSRQTGQVAIDGVYLAEVRVEKAVKGQSVGVIFIPFRRDHFLTNRAIEGPWTRRTYQTGEHLRMYLRQNGPFFEPIWWNAVQPLGSRSR